MMCMVDIGYDMKGVCIRTCKGLVSYSSMPLLEMAKFHAIGISAICTQISCAKIFIATRYF